MFTSSRLVFDWRMPGMFATDYCRSRAILPFIRSKTKNCRGTIHFFWGINYFKNFTDFLFLQKLEKNNTLEQLTEALKKPKISPTEFNIPKLRHFIYKNKNTHQYVYPMYDVPYREAEKQRNLLRLYTQLHEQINSPSRPLKLLFQQLKTEAVLGWVGMIFYFANSSVIY